MNLSRKVNQTMFRSPIAIQRHTYDGQAKACWCVIQVGYTRFLFRKFWCRNQDTRPFLWVRLWAPSQSAHDNYRRRWFSLSISGRSIFHVHPDSGYCGR